MALLPNHPLFLLHHLILCLQHHLSAYEDRDGFHIVNQKLLQLSKHTVFPSIAKPQRQILHLHSYLHSWLQSLSLLLLFLTLISALSTESESVATATLSSLHWPSHFLTSDSLPLSYIPSSFLSRLHTDSPRCHIQSFFFQGLIKRHLYFRN